VVVPFSTPSTKGAEMRGQDPMRYVLGQWKAAFDGHETDVIANLFTPDAVFQGFGPAVIVGREAIRGYYDAVPSNRSADLTIVHTYAIGEDVAGGFVDVTFSDPAGWEAAVHLSLVLQRTDGKWLIRQYHVSQVMTQH
jgi:uncharacterized protein (TIGR02246 family)